MTFMTRDGRGKRCDLRCSNYRAPIDTPFCSPRIWSTLRTPADRDALVHRYITDDRFTLESSINRRSIIPEVSAGNPCEPVPPVRRCPKTRRVRGHTG